MSRSVFYAMADTMADTMTDTTTYTVDKDSDRSTCGHQDNANVYTHAYTHIEDLNDAWAPETHKNAELVVKKSKVESAEKEETKKRILAVSAIQVKRARK